MERPLSAQELRRGDTGRRKLSKNFSTEAVAYSAAHVESNTFKTIRVEVECRGYRIAVVEDLVAWGSQVLKLRIEPFLRFTNVELAGCNAMGVIVALEIDGVIYHAPTSMSFCISSTISSRMGAQSHTPLEISCMIRSTSSLSTTVFCS
ncbi:hypothetical protein KC359_g171 [Hortaea werneckii]|nr:hypothetical protein KC359_g171 [Hortaea werneckii]